MTGLTLNTVLSVADRAAHYVVEAVCLGLLVWLLIQHAKDVATVTDPVCRIVMPERGK